MAKSEFDAELKTGIDILDNQHKVMFDLIKDLSNAIQVGVDKKILDTLLGVLRDYAFHHFQTEEDLFAEHRSFEEHCLEHYKLIKQLNGFILDFRNNRGLPSVSSFLEDWLIVHIKQRDLPTFKPQPESIPAMIDDLMIDDFDTFTEERRRSIRLSSDEVVDGEILANCYNATRLKSSRARITNLSPGGLKLEETSGNEVSDLLIVTCSIGKNFKMKEKVIVKSVQGKACGVEFIAPGEETVHFLTNLYGSVHLNRAKIS
jgi:hemerythrin-like metal-binding protein